MSYRQVEIRVAAEELEDHSGHRRTVAERLGVAANEIRHLSLYRRSIDARRKPPTFVLLYRVWLDDSYREERAWEPTFRDVRNASEVLIVGFGPAGMFAALKLIEAGLKPVVFERGKPVRERRRDIAAVTKLGVVNPDSNYCFGEGGAGTFSDGKLYTRATKRGSIERVLSLFVYFGASPEILIDAHPHIGTNKLPAVVQAMRESIIASGGEVHFNARVTGVERDASQITGVTLADGRRYQGRALILATGHSARDVFSLLADAGVRLEAKPFALGVRVEHSQAFVDSAQYRCAERPAALPAASYALRHQTQLAPAGERGVFSFCMCPGGIICPAATQPGEIVVNGWSPSKRNSRFANSGIVVEISAADLAAFGGGVDAGIKLQQQVEQAAFRAGGGGQVAPAQRLGDFVAGRNSQDLPESSYIPGLRAANLADVIPQPILLRLRQAFSEFDKKIRGYLHADAVVVATESRTSSPIRIPRDPQTLMHPELAGLFPTGEGAGYAGGIVSAAMDGERVAEAAIRFLHVAPPGK